MNQKSHPIVNSFLLLLLLTYLQQSNADGLQVDRIDVPLSVDASNVGLFNSPIFSYNNDIYVSAVTSNLDNSKSTVVGKYSPDNRWSFSKVEPKSMNNQYHAQPSIALDKQGYVHVTYNMHSSPWQYSVSSRSEDISSWDFKGQKLNGDPSKKKSAVVLGEGSALIPGNRITYQFMAVDNNGDVYISYREALINNKDTKYGDRQWSLGVSKYNVTDKKWYRLGGDGINTPLVTEPGYRPQVGHMYFDRNNRLHLVWNWYVEYSKDGSNKKNTIAYAYSDDGGKSFYTASGTKLNFPISRTQSEMVTEPDYYLSYAKVAAFDDGMPVVLYMPKSPSTKKRSIKQYDNVSGWGKAIPTPYGSTNFYVDKTTIVSISSGLRVHWKERNSSGWHTHELDVYNGPYVYWLDMAYISATGDLRFLAQSKNNNKLTIYTLKH